jgi:hypothetical protein
VSPCSNQWSQSLTVCRSNIDPAGVHPDAELNACLDLILSDPMATEALRSKLALDCVVSHEGANFSAGEKQLGKSQIRPPPHPLPRGLQPD